MLKNILCFAGVLVLLAACSQSDSSTAARDAKREYPQSNDRDIKDSRGKLTGDGGLSLGGDDAKEQASPIGVNGFLWQASLDTLSFLPLTSADPFGGVLITDWYEDPKTPGERFKVTALILSRSLRADAVKVSVFKQGRDASGNWQDVSVNPSVGRDLEDTILTRARQLKVKQMAE